MGCAMGTVRYILFFFNFILALAGLSILVVGIMQVKSEDASLNNVIHGQLSTPAIAFSVIGACVFIFAFFGCCGALRESHCMISTYAVLLLTLFLLQVAVAVLAYSYRSQAKDAVTKGVEELFQEYKDKNESRKAVDTIQSTYHCCGSTNVNTPWDTLGIKAPDSCYHNEEKYSTGCISTLMDMIQGGLSTITQVAIAIGVVEVVGIVFALCLANSIRRSELRGYA